MALTTSLLSGVTINEIGGSPSAGQDLNGNLIGTDDDQFIELVNTSGSTVDISGWQIYENTVVVHTFAPGTMLAAGERLVVVDSDDTLMGFPPAPTPVIGVYSDAPIGPSALDVIALVDPTTPGSEEYIILKGSVSFDPDPPALGTDDLTIAQILADYPGATQIGLTEVFQGTPDGQSAQRSGDGDSEWHRAEATAGGENTEISCFAPGTLISTPSGARPVEDFEPGDMVLTADGRAVPVRFNLVQSTEKRAVMPERLEPVRISAGALGGGLPLRDLVVTGDHGMILDGLVINASALVNGASIDWVPFAGLPEVVSYYHIETEDHDVILAEGAPTETFIDIAHRTMFDNYSDYLDLYGAERIIPEMDRPRISSRRLVPEQIKARLGIGEPVLDLAGLLSA